MIILFRKYVTYNWDINKSNIYKIRPEYLGAKAVYKISKNYINQKLK